MHRHYRKLIAGAVGILTLLANRYLGWDVLGVEPMIVDLIVSGLTLFGIERLANDPKPATSDFNGENV